MGDQIGENGPPGERTIETAGPVLANLIFGWDGPMWRYRNPWSEWHQGEPPADQSGRNNHS